MAGSPVEELISALDALDLDRALAMVAPACNVLMVDGRGGSGLDEVAKILGEFFAEIHRMEHRITAQWHLDDVWVAEIEADYELADRSRLLRLPRAFILREDKDGIVELHVYGAHEQAIHERDHGPGGILIGGRYMPPL